jgi:hypothetical protein
MRVAENSYARNFRTRAALPYWRLTAARFGLRAEGLRMSHRTQAGNSGTNA